jgi:hypothetical protein
MRICFTWIEALLRSLGNDGALPLPLAGEGWGGGACQEHRRVMEAFPHPPCLRASTSPASGRGDAEYAELPNSEPADSQGSGVLLLRQMRRQRVIGRLAEERGFLGGGFQKLLVLVVDVVAELNRLVLCHPCR